MKHIIEFIILLFTGKSKEAVCERGKKKEVYKSESIKLI